MTVSATCQTCGTPLASQLGRRKFCSGRCRKAQYAQTCIDCGAPTSGSEGRKAEPRCRRCGAAVGHEKLRVWTRELVIARIQEWASLYGEPPAQPDWAPNCARYLNDEARARRFEDANGHWPWLSVVCRAFGTWNAAIAAAGFTPRAPHATPENQARSRVCRTKAAA